MKILLDTDIGSDIDDSVCLAYLLAHPDCELLGVTTVGGRPGIRADIAASLCVQAGMDIPISVGAAQPLIVDQHMPEPELSVALNRWPHNRRAGKTAAFDLLRRTIRRYPNEIALVAIGPLTNIALLCATDPEAAALVRVLVIMGGNFAPTSSAGDSGLQAKAGIEWNMYCDPHAAAIVFRSAIPHVQIVGHDVTRRVSMTEAEVRADFRSPLLLQVLDYADEFFRRDNDVLTFHDPLAGALALREELFTLQRGTIEVDLSPDHEGMTQLVPDVGGRHEVVCDVDAARYFEHFFQVVQGAR